MELAKEYGELSRKTIDMRNEALSSGEPVPFADKQINGYAILKPRWWLDEVQAMERDLERSSFGDAWDPLVDFGHGTAKGLTKGEHVAFTRRLDHPFRNDPNDHLCPELLDASKFDLE